MTKRYVCYIKKQDRVKDETKKIIISEKELNSLIGGEQVQGYLMHQIEMIVTDEDQYREELKRMYLMGYQDAQCNHIEDADNAVEEHVYAKRGE